MLLIATALVGVGIVLIYIAIKQIESVNELENTLSFKLNMYDKGFQLGEKYANANRADPLAIDVSRHTINELAVNILKDLQIQDGNGNEHIIYTAYRKGVIRLADEMKAVIMMNEMKGNDYGTEKNVCEDNNR